MHQNQPLEHFKRSQLWLLLSIGFIFASSSTNAIAQSSSDRLVFDQLPQAQDPSFPGSAIGRGTRRPTEGDLCGKSILPLMALVPHVPKPKNEPNPDPDRVLGLTAAAQPVFWFYHPYSSQGNLSGELELREVINGKLKRLSRQTVGLPSTPGLMPVQLQDKSLEAGKKYQWVFSVQCIPGEPSANDTVSGWVQRVDNPKLQGELQKLKTPKQKVQAYAKAGLWHETLTILADDLCQRDRPQAERWFADLMRSVGLADLATKSNSAVLQTCPKP